MRAAQQSLTMERARRLTHTLWYARIGVAICDRRLRYQSVNLTLAQMHGLPPEAFPGLRIQDVLGATAEKVASALDLVFTEGQPRFGVELSGQLPNRTECGHWVIDYIPVCCF